MMSNPDETAAPRPAGPTRSSWSTSARAEPAGPAHAVRRLPRPRLGLPRRLQEGPQGQPARPRGPGHRRRRPTASCRRPCMPADSRSSIANEPRQGDRKRDGMPVHLMDIHLEKGMHCVDCHFVQDVHGNTKLYGEVRAAIEIQCIDCHGTVDAAGRRCAPPARRPTRPAPKAAATWRRCARPSASAASSAAATRSIQNSMVETDLTLGGHPGRRHHRPRATRTTTRSRAWPRPCASTPTARWSGATCPAATRSACAHANDNMSCIACHSSWNPSCFGCHLPQKANMKMPQLHNEGDVTRNYVSYNFQTLRDDVYMLARDGDVTGNRIGPARSSCAVHVGSYNPTASRSTSSSRRSRARA